MRFERYYRPYTLEECFSLMEAYQGGFHLLAGGTDLIVRLKSGACRTHVVIDITHIPELSRIYRKGEGLYLGSTVRLNDILRCEELLQQPLSVLSCCAGHVATMAVRNMATLGGNSCNASPSADTAPGLLLLDAFAHIISAEGERYISMTEFYRSPGKTVLQQNELLAGFYLPAPAPRTRAHYYKYAIRGDSDIAIVGAGTLLTLDESNRILKARIALSSVAPTPIRMSDGESLLVGQFCSQELFEQVSQACAKGCSPISDHRASAGYRRRMAAFWVKQALIQTQPKQDI